MSSTLADPLLLHGDCLDLLQGLPDGSIDAIITDPPYGISYQSSRRTDSLLRKPIILNDHEPHTRWLAEGFRVLKNGGCLICFHEWKFAECFRSAIEEAGFTLKSQVVWDRDWHGMGDLKASFAPSHDLIWFAVKGKGFKFPGKRPKSVLRFRRVAAEALVHPTEKPVALMEHLVESVTSCAGRVLDPFSGSGSTGVAAANTGRGFVGMELDGKYFSIAQDRIRKAREEFLSRYPDSIF